MMIKVPPTAGITGKCGIKQKKAKRRTGFRNRIPSSVGNTRTCPVQTMLGAFWFEKCLDLLEASKQQGEHQR